MRGLVTAALASQLTPCSRAPRTDVYAGKDVYGFLQKCVDHGKDFNLTAALKTKTITNGLRYSLATGNWGDQKGGATKAGVSQVLNRLTRAQLLFFIQPSCNPSHAALSLSLREHAPREGGAEHPEQRANEHYFVLNGSDGNE